MKLNDSAVAEAVRAAFDTGRDVYASGVPMPSASELADIFPGKRVVTVLPESRSGKDLVSAGDFSSGLLSVLRPDVVFIPFAELASPVCYGYKSAYENIAVARDSSRFGVNVLALLPAGVTTAAFAPKFGSGEYIAIRGETKPRTEAIAARNEKKAFGYILSRPRVFGRSIVFCRTRRAVGQFVSASSFSDRVFALDGSTGIKDAERIISDFYASDSAFLFCTKSAVTYLYGTKADAVYCSGLPYERAELARMASFDGEGAVRVVYCPSDYDTQNRLIESYAAHGGVAQAEAPRKKQLSEMKSFLDSVASEI